ncbi:hypothetical protein RT99_05890 [Flavobacterium sp. MEB061]|uniref:hypothetical protein n=1 Tax=Flavobacterium sp. MEB061 TaxID=1587524 RepID=UPI0005AD1EB4|nr:hypothetical protein [Flavobacterium sp. MEB061]KIQ22638.1 hypothetical protein RT99_05890 [Flavobacterium sp. MEB061]
MNLPEEILNLKEKKARIFFEIESLATVNDQVFTKFGKVVSELMLKEKQLLRIKNENLDEEN